MPIPGDARDNYLPRMEWVDKTRLVIQQLNRLQNRLVVYVADVSKPQADVVLTEQDDAWIDVQDTLHWLGNRSQFAWLSERNGWQHIYLASVNDKSIKPVTSGDFDVTEILGIDDAGKWIYFYASPANATQLYLYRIHFDGSALQRVTPATKTGNAPLCPLARWSACAGHIVSVHFTTQDRGGSPQRSLDADCRRSQCKT